MEKNILNNLIHDTSIGDKNKMIQILQTQPGCFYYGIDPTASTVHLGHLIGLRLATSLVKCGWKCIILVGGYTGSIGDPTGKDKTRAEILQSDVQLNSQGIIADIHSVMAPYEVKYVNNADWLNEMTLAQYMNIAGKISVNHKIKMDTYATRISNHSALTMKEFIYSDLQSIDFLHLYEKYNCTLQIGGKDQWGNISQGVSLIGNVYGITTPLLTVKNAKMGKTTNNSVSIYEDPLKLIHFLNNLPEGTKTQLSSMFCTTNDHDYIYYILEFLYHNDFEKYLHEYQQRQNCQNGNDAKNEWIIKINTTKLSTVIGKVFNISNEQAKRYIEQGSCYINNQKQNENIHLKFDRYSIAIPEQLKQFVEIV